MDTTHRQRVTLLAIATVTLAAILPIVGGCEVLRTWDEQLAQAFDPDRPPPVTTQPGVSVTPAPDPAAPFVEIAAGLAALLGYGGLAQYIRSTKKNGRSTTDHLQAQITVLQATLKKLEQ